MGGHLSCGLRYCLLSIYNRKWFQINMIAVFNMLSLKFGLVENFPTIDFTFATTDQLAIGSVLRYITKDRPVPPVPRDPAALTLVCVLEKTMIHQLIITESLDSSLNLNFLMDARFTPSFRYASTIFLYCMNFCSHLEMYD